MTAAAGFPQSGKAGPGRCGTAGPAPAVCEECFETAMRAGGGHPKSIASQYQMWHATRHGVTPTVTADAEAGEALTDLDQQVLRFERFWWRRPGAKVQAIGDTFGLTMIGYYQHLNGLLTLPCALAFDPPLVQRLRRLQAESGRLRLAMR